MYNIYMDKKRIEMYTCMFFVKDVKDVKSSGTEIGKQGLISGWPSSDEIC